MPDANELIELLKGLGLSSTTAALSAVFVFILWKVPAALSGLQSRKRGRQKEFIELLSKEGTSVDLGLRQRAVTHFKGFAIDQDVVDWCFRVRDGDQVLDLIPDDWRTYLRFDRENDRLLWRIRFASARLRTVLFIGLLLFVSGTIPLTAFLGAFPEAVQTLDADKLLVYVEVGLLFAVLGWMGFLFGWRASALLELQKVLIRLGHSLESGASSPPQDKVASTLTEGPSSPPASMRRGHRRHAPIDAGKARVAWFDPLSRRNPRDRLDHVRIRRCTWHSARE